MLFSPHGIPNPELPMLSGVALDYWYNPHTPPPLPNSDILPWQLFQTSYTSLWFRIKDAGEPHGVC